jgi:hypothetical protein
MALGVLACDTKSATGGGESAATIQQARAAIKALEDRDAAAVEACEADVRSCFAALPDGGGAGACEDLREQCREAKEALEDVRKPAVDCWRHVEQCAVRGKPFAHGDAGAAPDAGPHCSVAPKDCTEAGEDADEDRNPILECKSEVRECLSSVKHRADDWREQCGEVREACSDICGLAKAGHERGRRGERDGLRERIRQLLERIRARKHGSRGHGSDDHGADAGND